MVGDAAWDVLAVADELGLPEFGVVGRSGGGPHALACAAQLDKSRLRCAVAMVSLAPTDAEHLNWFWGMADSNVTEYNLADSGADAVEADLAVRAKQIRDDPESLLRFLLPELTGPDRRIVSDVAIWRQLTDAYAEAFREGADGWIDDVLAFRRPWGFDLTKITVPVRFWHGADDVFSPISHTCWLAGQIPHAEVELQQGAAHFNAVEILPRVLAQMKKFHGSERLRIQSSH